MKSCFKIHKPNVKKLKVLYIPLVALFIALPIGVLYIVTLGVLDATDCLEDIMDWIVDI